MASETVTRQQAAEIIADMLTWRGQGRGDTVDARIGLAALDRIADGQPLGRSELVDLARRHDADDPHTRADRVASLAEIDDGGAIVGIHGLSLSTCAHVVRLPRGERGTWCALDTVFLPPLLRAPAEVESTCAVTGEPVSLRIDPDGFLRIAEPASLALTFPVPDPDALPRSHDELRALFCGNSRFARDLDAAAELAGDGVETLEIEDATELGRAIAESIRARAR